MPTATPPLVAFHGQPAIKAKYLLRLEAHRAAGDLTRGPFGWMATPDRAEASEWFGMAVYCAFHDKADPYGAAERQIGVPLVLARLLEDCFKSMSAARYAIWPGQFLQAIPVGADLSGVWSRLAHWLLVAAPDVRRVAQTPGQRAAIQAVADLYLAELAGPPVPRRAWLTARQVVDAEKATARVAHRAAAAALEAGVAEVGPAAPGVPYAAAQAGAAATLTAAPAWAATYAAALAASRALTTASKAAKAAAAALLAHPDRVAFDASATVAAASYVAALATPSVAVGAAAHRLAHLADEATPGIMRDRNARRRVRHFALAAFAAEVSTGHYDAVAGKLLALLAAASVPDSL